MPDRERRNGFPLAVLLLASMAAAAAARAQKSPIDLKGFRVVDLTYPFDEKTINWPTSPTTFKLDRLAYGKTEGGWFYASNTFCTPEHGGTHLDAPIHFAAGKRTTDQVPVEQLIGPAVVIDVSAQAAADRDYRLTLQD